MLWSQKIDPAPSFILPKVKKKKLKRIRSDRWKIEDYELRFSNVFFGFATNDSGQQVYLSRYPESDIATGVVTLDQESAQLRAEGMATFITPDGLKYQGGSFRQNAPHGPWVAISMRPMEEACFSLTFETHPDEVVDILKACYPDSAQQESIQVLRAIYANGKLEGPASRSTLAGTTSQSLTYRNGNPDGEELNEYYWKTPSFTAIHSANGSDTTFAEPERQKGPLEIKKHSERMPAFVSPDCPIPDIKRATTEEMEAYNKCTTKAMLYYVYSNIRYPRSSREAGVDGLNVTTFVVEKDGTLTGIRTTCHISAVLDEEARRLITGMPRWTPGYQDGEPVRVQFNLPTKFRLE